jgi:hypothetical protein
MDDLEALPCRVSWKAGCAGRRPATDSACNAWACEALAGPGGIGSGDPAHRAARPALPPDGRRRDPTLAQTELGFALYYSGLGEADKVKRALAAANRLDPLNAEKADWGIGP